MDRHQHPTNNDVLGAPPGVPIDECNALPITRIQYSDGTPAVASYWRPTRAELGRALGITAVSAHLLVHKLHRDGLVVIAPRAHRGVEVA